MKILPNLIASLCVFTSANAAENPAAKTNVVLIFIDDMGYGDIGPFGSVLGGEEVLRAQCSVLSGRKISVCALSAEH